MIMKSFRKIIVLGLGVFTGLLSYGQNNPDSIIVLKNQYVGGNEVTGIIQDAANGKGLSGIRITYKQYSAAISDSTGKFTLKVPSADVSILLEGEGFQTKEIALKGRRQVSTVMYEDTYTSFYDQAVLPFKQDFKSHTPYSVSSVQTNGNWDKVTENTGSYLQGRIAGLNAVRRSGTPNIGATLMLRGISSLYATNTPLVVVDGVIFDNQDYGGSIIGNHYNDPLSMIDVRDIDNITVLKDGSSTYGTKGANGVIIITTARARELGTRIDLAVYGGMNFTPHHLPMMNASDYRIYLSDMLQSRGMSPAAIQALPYMNDDPSNPDYYRYHNNTNWQDLVFNKSYTRNIYMKVTGGDNIAKYALSLGYMGNGGITRNTDLKQYNMRFNGDRKHKKRHDCYHQP
jgi:TonB-dependent SusC/RagA subfamily outer membrane receptor